MREEKASIKFLQVPKGKIIKKDSMKRSNWEERLVMSDDNLTRPDLWKKGRTFLKVVC